MLLVAPTDAYLLRMSALQVDIRDSNGNVAAQLLLAMYSRL